MVAAAAAAGSHPELKALLVDPTWRLKLGPELEKPSAQQLQKFLQQEWAQHKIFPPQHLIFRCVMEPRASATDGKPAVGSALSFEVQPEAVRMKSWLDGFGGQLLLSHEPCKTTGCMSTGRLTGRPFAAQGDEQLPAGRCQGGHTGCAARYC